MTLHRRRGAPTAVRAASRRAALRWLVGGLLVGAGLPAVASPGQGTAGAPPGQGIPAGRPAVKLSLPERLLQSWSSPEVSTVIYPQPSADPTAAPPFDHKVHVGRLGLGCLVCHAAEAVQASPTDELRRPSEAVCRGCHRAGDGRGRLSPRSAPVAALKFSHRLHGPQRLPCERCHGDVTAIARPQLPSMASCLGCHDGRTAPARCPTCHLTQADGTLQVTFPWGRLMPSSALGGSVVHDLPFRTGHAKVARERAGLCAACHTRSACDGCHTGALRPLEIHGNDYLSLHVVDARKSPTACQGCHRLQTFCVSCHERTGVGPATVELSPFRRSQLPSAAGRSFHPPGWVEYDASSGQLLAVRGPNHHAFAAQRNLSACVSCHRESTCVGCHGRPSSPAGGLGFNPHGPAFARRCGALRDHNLRVCLRCHVPDDPLVSRCDR